ncbi:MAG: hypothetical protein H6R05_1163 [Burkholderiaceae bacterium]|nr:hypothetical protein [Burkholderiaceae bacterium]
MEKITCAKCGSVYELSYTRTIMRDKDVINCEICHNQIYSWSEAKIWSARLVVKCENHLK